MSVIDWVMLLLLACSLPYSDYFPFLLLQHQTIVVVAEQASKQVKVEQSLAAGRLVRETASGEHFGRALIYYSQF